MQYQKIYNQLVEKRKSNPAIEFFHKHHIIPKTFGGIDNNENIVQLTYREHIIAHKLLTKIYEGKQRSIMVWALCKMTISYRKNELFHISSRDYESAKKLYSKENPNKDKEWIARYKENHKNGLYKFDYDKAGKTLSNTLSKLSKEELSERVKKSCGTCDQIARAKAIKHGKSSLLKAIYPNGEIIEFLSYEADIKVGVSYGFIKDMIKRKKDLISIILNMNILKNIQVEINGTRNHH